jgi:hypothetical protein
MRASQYFGRSRSTPCVGPGLEKHIPIEQDSGWFGIGIGRHGVTLYFIYFGHATKDEEYLWRNEYLVYIENGAVSLNN